MDIPTDDRRLLDAFVAAKSQEAFAVLVTRHIGLVYAAARRRVGNAELAEDVTQAVFILLAAKAGTIRKETPLPVWLYKVTGYTSANAIKMEKRRQHHERRAAEHRPTADESAIADRDESQLLLPMLDAAIDRLAESDRAAVVLRYFQGLSFERVGMSLGVSAHAAEVRVSRAIEKLRKFFAACKVAAPSGAIVATLTARSADAAPPAVAGRVMAGATGGSPLASATAKSMGRFAAKKVAAAAAMFLLLASVAAASFMLLGGRPGRSAPANKAVIAAASQPAVSPMLGPSNIRVDAAFDCGTPEIAVPDGPNHVTITLNQFQLDWWMFRLKGVAGKTVTIDIKADPNSGQNLAAWRTLTPVYSYSTDLNDPRTYATGPMDVAMTDNDQDVWIPNTDGQNWHYVQNARLVTPKVFTITQAFTSDAVYIAGRVPYTPGYCQKFIDSIAANPLAKVIDLGKTDQGRPIRVVQIGTADAASERSKPCVLIAGGEQAYQADGMWACQGCIEFLLGDSVEAKKLRDAYVFLIVPMLDPDGTAQTDPRLVGSFRPGSTYPTSIAYINWLRQRVSAGDRLDLILELHSLQSSECEHLERVQVAGLPRDRPGLINMFQDSIIRQFQANHLTVTRWFMYGGNLTPSRFSQWASTTFGAMDIIYEVNSQAPARHLTLSQLKDTGRLFALACGDFLSSSHGQRLLASVDKARAALQPTGNGPASATQPSPSTVAAPPGRTTQADRLAIQDICSALARREAKLQNCSFAFTETRTFFKDGVAVDTALATDQIAVKYKNGAMWMDFSEKDDAHPELSITHMLQLWDGTRCTWFEHVKDPGEPELQGGIGDREPEVLKLVHCFSMLGLRQAGISKPWSKWIISDLAENGTVATVARGAGAGEDFVKLVLTLDNGVHDQFIITLLPGKDFAARDFELRSTGEVAESWHVDRFQNFDGLWMPVEVTYSNGIPKLKIGNKGKVTINSLTLKPPSDAEMQIKFPLGTNVMDAIKKEWYAILPDGKRQYYDIDTGKVINPPGEGATTKAASASTARP